MGEIQYLPKTRECQLFVGNFQKKSSVLERDGFPQKILQSRQYLETSNECVRYWQTAEDDLGNSADYVYFHVGLFVCCIYVDLFDVCCICLFFVRYWQTAEDKPR